MPKPHRPSARASYADARVVVLGAAGFIGRWVARALAAQGAQLYLIVRARQTAKPVLAQYGVSGTLVELDLQDLSAVRCTLRALAPSITFNLAGYGVDHTEQDEGPAYRINADLVRVIGEALAGAADPAWPGQALVHVGSALEYGEIGGVLAEDREPRPTTLYGRSKLAGTTQVIDQCQQSRLAAVVARLFTVYGPGEYPGRLLPSLIRAASTDEALPLSHGRQRRDFTYVADVAAGLLHLGLAPPQAGTVVNLATGRLTSVRRFVEIAAGILGVPVERLQFGRLPTRFAELEHAPLRLDRLHSLTGWAPTTGIPAGIRQTWEFESCSIRRPPAPSFTIPPSRLPATPLEQPAW